MLYVKFNKDGSVNELSITESINQGNDNVNTVFATFDSLSLTSPTIKAEFELPDQSVVEVNTSATTIDDESGYQLAIPKEATKYAGTVNLYFKVSNSQGALYTQKVPLLINKTSFVYEEEEEE